MAQAEPQMQSDQQQCIYRALLDFGYFINQAGENAPWLASEAMRVASEAASAAASRFWETATWAVRRWSLRCFLRCLRAAAKFDVLFVFHRRTKDLRSWPGHQVRYQKIRHLEFM